MSAPDDIVEFWASAMDAFLQDFAEAHRGGNADVLAIECAKLAQLGGSMHELFSRLVKELEASGTDASQSRRARAFVRRLVEKHVSKVQGVSVEPARPPLVVDKGSSN